jgi:hydrogenase expression/formation protein HypE
VLPIIAIETFNLIKMNDPEEINLDLVCPRPLYHSNRIVLGHGSGGKLSHDLITKVFQPYFENEILKAKDDAGVIALNDDIRIAYSTDSHVVWPLFFPGGDIGRLAICGTVNDIAMMGAEPKHLTAGFILEEGLEVDILRRVIASMQAAAQEAGVQIIAGDTKVVQKGKADGLYINTSGIGIVPPGISLSGNNAKPGDKILLSGTIGDHGIAVLGARGDLGFTTELESDVAPLNHLVKKMLQMYKNIHTLRDPTRGGLATTLNEIARQSGVCINIDEKLIPIQANVSAACEMLGFDPLYVANEGKLIAFIEPEKADSILAIMKTDPHGKNAAVIGEVTDDYPGRVLMKTALGTNRIVDIPAGELLPRIC